MFIDDPWLEHLPEPFYVRYSRIARGSNKVWWGSWYFLNDEVSGHLNGRSVLDDVPELKAAGKAQSTVAVSFPLLDDAGTRKSVMAGAGKKLDGLRACYEQALAGEQGATVPSPAHVRIGFAVEKGNPMWVSVKDAGGLPSSVSSCLSIAVSRWAGLFPQSGPFKEAQQMEVDFARLGNAAHVEAPTVAATTPTPPAKAATAPADVPLKPPPARLPGLTSDGTSSVAGVPRSEE